MSIKVKAIETDLNMTRDSPLSHLASSHTARTSRLLKKRTSRAVKADKPSGELRITSNVFGRTVGCVVGLLWGSYGGYSTVLFRDCRLHLDSSRCRA